MTSAPEGCNAFGKPRLTLLMDNKKMKHAIFLIFLFFTTLSQADSTTIQFLNGWIKQLPQVVPLRAGYLQIKNPDNKDYEITGFSSDDFEKVEMHETKMVDDIMKMVELESIYLPANGQVELKPGGKHLMMITPLLTLQIGDIVELNVTFSDDTTQQIQLEVKK